MEQLSVVPLDLSMASRAVAEQRKLLDLGERVGGNDALIGGAALSTQETVLTRNVDEFEQYGVEVEEY